MTLNRLASVVTLSPRTYGPVPVACTWSLVSTLTDLVFARICNYDDLKSIYIIHSNILVNSTSFAGFYMIRLEFVVAGSHGSFCV